jgi:hypothetical protein
MLRRARLLASALFVVSASVLCAQARADQVTINNDCFIPPGNPNFCAIEVIGVEMRSACDAWHEWWVQAKNTSTTESFTVHIHAEATSFACTVSADTTVDLAPGQCFYTWHNYPNPPNHPCDDACCYDTGDPTHQTCNTCTSITTATVQATRWKPSVRSPWQDLAQPYPTVATIANGAPSGGVGGRCSVINVCAPGPHYHEWGMTPCQAGL